MPKDPIPAIVITVLVVTGALQLAITFWGMPKFRRKPVERRIEARQKYLSWMNDVYDNLVDHHGLRLERGADYHSNVVGWHFGGTFDEFLLIMSDAGNGQLTIREKKSGRILLYLSPSTNRNLTPYLAARQIADFYMEYMPPLPRAPKVAS